MSDVPTPSDSVVVAFPARKSEAAAQARLQRAMAALVAATQEQALAVATWRHSLSDLSEGIGQLGASMERYRDATARTGAQVDELGRQARRIEATMDTLLRLPGAEPHSG